MNKMKMVIQFEILHINSQPLCKLSVRKLWFVDLMLKNHKYNLSCYLYKILVIHNRMILVVLTKFVKNDNIITINI